MNGSHGSTMSEFAQDVSRPIGTARERKACFKCGKVKKISEFYKHPEMADGHVNKCKECNKKDVKENYRINIDHYSKYERGRANLPHRVKARDDYAQTEA